MATTATAVNLPYTNKTTAERMFPSFTSAQIERLAAHGRRRPVAKGEVLFEAGSPVSPFFVVTAGQVDVIRPSLTGGDLITVHGPGQFTGEVNMLAGRRALVTARAIEAGEVIEIDRERLLALVQGDAEISEILMRAFILRRSQLLARGLGDVIVVGSAFCPETLRVKEFLTRNVHPYTYIDLDHDADVQVLLDRFHVTPKDVPVVICRGETVLRAPSNRAIAECLGFNEALDAARIYDLVVVGAGPAGLAAAVYAASEGLDVVVLESTAPGGQAGSSSKIENYLGFPTGISGHALAARAFAQAQKFGAHVLIAKSAVQLTCVNRPYTIDIGDAAPVRARAVVIATGAEYRKPPLE
ncbi:MAG: FAD-dependent oxidoreductase, partial [Steroidobacteraceae bacterium]